MESTNSFGPAQAKVMNMLSNTICCSSLARYRSLKKLMSLPGPTARTVLDPAATCKKEEFKFPEKLVSLSLPKEIPTKVPT